MAYTLISFIGTGMYKHANEKNPTEGYLETTYFLPENKSCTTRLFLQALLETQFKEISQVILVGTRTSSWDALVDKDKDERDSTIELWSNLYDECETQSLTVPIKGISDENLKALEIYLTERFKLPVKLLCHTQVVDDNSASEIFETYTKVTSVVQEKNNILFDITHGFRSMPVLLYQALQFSLSNSPERKVELVYGELDLTNTKEGHLRSLNRYWDFSALSESISVFSAKLDGFRLAELIKDIWPKGSKAIKAFTEIVQTNFSLQIIEVLAQIKNALASCPEDAPEWLIPVKELLEDILKIKDSSVSKTLYNYARLLFNHHMNTQAIITLQTCVEALIKEEYSDDSIGYGDYDWWQSQGKSYLKMLKNQTGKEVKDQLYSLENLRNQIAHGGGKNKSSEIAKASKEQSEKLAGYPKAANIENIFTKGVKGVDALYAAFNK